MKRLIAVIVLSIFCAVQPAEAGAIRLFAKGVKVAAKATGKAVKVTSKVVWKVVY